MPVPMSAAFIGQSAKHNCPSTKYNTRDEAISRRRDALLIAFDLIELDGEDLRRTPIEPRKRTLAKLVRRPHAGIVLNEVFEGDGDILFAHACKLGVKASCRSGPARATDPGAPIAGSRLRTRRAATNGLARTGVVVGLPELA
jgi:hypothetical protein